jgi:hypothetical protein
LRNRLGVLPDKGDAPKRHRFAEGKAALLEFARGYVEWLSSIDRFTHDDFNDLHQLFAASAP